MSDLGPVTPPPVPPAAPAAPAPAPAAQTPVAVPPPATPSGGQSGGQGGVPTQPQPSPTTVLQGEASQIAASSSELAKGGEISAQVVARDNATLLIRTAAGNVLTLASNLAVKLEQANIAVLNAALKIQLNPENPQQATITSAAGVTLQPPLAAQAQPPTAAQLAQAIAPPQPGNSAAPVLPQAGQIVTATVVPAQAGGNPANAALPAGSQIQVVVQSATLPPRTAPQSTIAPTAPAAAPVPPAPSAPAATPAAAPVPPAPAGAAPAAATALPTGTVAVPPAVSSPAAVTLLQQAPPPAQTAPQVTPQHVPTPASPVPAQPAAQQPVVPPPPMPNSPAAALAAQTQPVPVTAGQVLSGVVSGQAANGQVLVSTPQGVLSLSLSQPLPPGTQLSLELAAIARPPMSTPTTLGPPPLAGVLTRLQGEWPALQQTLDAVRAIDPGLAQRLQNELLPQANVRLAATALQFMAAAAAGNAQAWLGSEAVRKLEQQGRGDLLKKLDDDFRELGRLNSRQSDSDWQALVMPMLVNGKVEPVQIFMRRRKDREKKQAQTRFLIDFDLESTGPIQFDGFVSSKQLDLILRSETEFGPAFRNDVTAIFTGALEVTGMAGSIRFHDREKPLAWPSPELEAKGHSTEIKA